MDNSGSKRRLRNSISLKTPIIPRSSVLHFILERFRERKSFAGGGVGSSTQRSSGGRRTNAGFLQQNLCCHQSLRRISSNNRSFSVKQLCQENQVSYGNNSNGPGCRPKRRLDGLSGSPRCLSPRTNPPKESEVSPICMESEGSPIQSPMFRPDHGSTSIHQNHGSDFGLSPQARNSPTSIPRRLAPPCLDATRSDRSDPGPSSIMPSTRDSHQSPEIIISSSSEDDLFGSGDSDSSFEGFPVEDQGRSVSAILQVFLTSRFQTAKMWSSLLGHMASLIHLIPNAQLRMRGLQFRLRSQWSRHTQDDLVLISWTVDNLRDLRWWKQESNLLVGRNLQDITTDLLLYTDASSQGWGASLLHHTAGGLWSMEESTLHINILELRAVGLALHHFQHLLINKTVGVCSDNTTALAYLSHQGGTHSIPLNGEAQRILRWAEEKSIFIQTQFISGIRNVVADSLSRRNQVLSTEWTLHSDVCHSLWKIWGSPMIDPFATSQNFRLPNFVSPFPDPLAIATDAFLFSWDHKDLYAFPPFPMIRKVLNKLCQAQGTSLILIAPFWPRKEWFPDLIQVTVDTPRLLPTRRDLLRQPHFHRFHNGLHTLQLTAWKLSSDSCVIKDIPEEWRDSWRRLEGVLPM